MSIKAWYAFYPSDFQRDTELLTLEERLLYRDMLDIYWMNLGKLTEKDAKNICKKRGFSSQKFDKNWRKVSIYFPVIDQKTGKLTNKRMDEERDIALSKHKKAVENGARGGQANAKQTLQQKHKQKSSSPQSPSQSPSPEEKIKVKRSVDSGESTPPDPKPSDSENWPDRFDEFWSAFNLKKGKQGALKSWCSIAKKDRKNFNQIIEQAKLEAIHRPDDNPKFAQGWLTERRWEDGAYDDIGVDTIEPLHAMVIEKFAHWLPMLEQPIPQRWKISGNEKLLNLVFASSPEKHQDPGFWDFLFGNLSNDLDWINSDFRFLTLPWILGENFDKALSRARENYKKQGGNCA